MQQKLSSFSHTFIAPFPLFNQPHLWCYRLNFWWCFEVVFSFDYFNTISKPSAYKSFLVNWVMMEMGWQQPLPFSFLQNLIRFFSICFFRWISITWTVINTCRHAYTCIHTYKHTCIRATYAATHLSLAGQLMLCQPLH